MISVLSTRRPIRAVLAVLLCACSAKAFVPARQFFLEVEMANPSGGSAAIYYDVGQWYNERDSFRIAVPASQRLETYRFAMPAAPIRRIRFDLTDRQSTVTVGRFRLLDDQGRVIDTFGPESVRPMHSIGGYRIEKGLAEVSTGSDNPMLLIDRPLQAETAKALGVPLIGSPALTLLLLCAFGIATFSVVVVLRSQPRPRFAASVFAGVFLVVFGVRLELLRQFSHPMPFWDEWEMDGADLLMPFASHSLDWGALFVPQSEHRTLVSRLITLVGAIYNGEWDPRLGMVAGAAMYASSVSLLCVVAAASRTRLWLAAAAVVVVAASFPMDARNLLCGDQCQMYALNASAVTVLCLAVAPPSSGSIAAAALASALSVFTMASGCVAPLLGAGIAAAPLLADRRNATRRGALAAAFLCGGVAGVLLYRSAPFQGPTYAHSLHDFASALLARLAWPLSPSAFHVAFVWLPWTLLAGCLLARLRRPEPFDGFVAGLGLWVVANAAGLAHGRPFDHAPFDNKYYTSMGLVVPVAAFSLLQLVQSRRTLFAALAGLCVCCPAGASFVALLRQSHQSAANYSRQERAYDTYVEPFLLRGDRALLYELPGDKIPYWNGAELAAQIDSPFMQPWMPAVYRGDLAERPHPLLTGRQAPGPLTVACLLAMRVGLWIAGLGAASLCLITYRALRPHRDGAA